MSTEKNSMKAEMFEEITEENCGDKLKLIREISGMSRRELARILGVSEATIRRLEDSDSMPSDEFLNKLRALCIIGHEKFSRLPDDEKEKVGEMIGFAGGSASGIGAVIAAVSAAGVSGLSAAGITSGLAAIGGGMMIAGIGVVAAIPIATGLLGYGVIKGIKSICDANNLSCKEVNDRWEIRRPTTNENDDDSITNNISTDSEGEC